MSMMPTNEVILAVMRERGGTNPTYYIKNCLRSGWPCIETPYVLRRLKAMERAGMVQRAPSHYYHNMIHWTIPAPKGQS